MKCAHRQRLLLAIGRFKSSRSVRTNEKYAREALGGFSRTGVLASKNQRELKTRVGKKRSERGKRMKKEHSFKRDKRGSSRANRRIVRT